MRCLSILIFIPVLLAAQPSRITSGWKTNKDLSGASYGYCVAEAKTGKVIEALNEDRQLIPASTLKVLSTATALKLLGADFRFQTRLFYSGHYNAKTGVLTGDLIILGSGDPTLQSELFAKESNVTESWANILKEKGLKQITGSVIGDASAFSREVNDEWIWGDIGNYYGTSACGLSYMDNKFKLVYNSGAKGSTAKLIKQEPVYSGRDYALSSQVIAEGTDDEAIVYGDPFSFNREIKGRIPPNKINYEVEASLPDPALLCAQMLCKSLLKTGVKIDPSAAKSCYEKNEVTANLKPVYTHVSPPLSKIIYFTNLKSNNLYCESLIRCLGNGNLKDGLDRVKKFCHDNSLAAGQLFMADACGLSRANTVSVGLLTDLLCKLTSDSATYMIMKASFPVAGNSGSMAGIGKGTFIEGNLAAKTGYIHRVRAYCGYVRSRSGKELAFSVMLNNYNCSAHTAKLYLEKLLVAFGEL